MYINDETAIANKYFFSRLDIGLIPTCKLFQNVSLGLYQSKRTPHK